MYTSNIYASRQANNFTQNTASIRILTARLDALESENGKISLSALRLMFGLELADSNCTPTPSELHPIQPL
jgi:hypothetical protein